MNLELRKLHLRIWIVVAIAVPICIVLSILARPSFPFTETINRSTVIQALPQNVKEVETDNLKINLRGENTLAKQLEIIVKKPLKSASMAVYYLENKAKGKYIGGMQSKGVYRFAIDKSIQGIILYDPIKKRDIQQIEF